MEQVTSAAETLFSTAYPNIKKTTDISSVLISVSLCVVGAVVLLYSLKMDDASSVLGPLSLVCSSLLVIVGLIRLLKQASDLRADRQRGEERKSLLERGQAVRFARDT